MFRFVFLYSFFFLRECIHVYFMQFFFYPGELSAEQTGFRRETDAGATAVHNRSLRLERRFSGKAPTRIIAQSVILFDTSVLRFYFYAFFTSVDFVRLYFIVDACCSLQRKFRRLPPREIFFYLNYRN